jgi:hypothetical protein
VTGGPYVFAGTVASVFTSTDNGALWMQNNAGLADTDVTVLALEGSPLFAGTASGVFASLNGGTTWTLMDPGPSLPTDIAALAITGASIFAGDGSTGLWTDELARVTAVAHDADATPHPGNFSLAQNYPNPFNPTTVIKYALPVESRVSLRIHNVLGQEVCTLVDEVQSAGYRSVKWDSKTGSGFQAASGVYFTRLDVKGVNGEVFSEVRKMLLMK